MKSIRYGKPEIRSIQGIYIEFKEPWLNPKGFEQIVYDVLANTQDMNIIEKPEPEDTPFYINNGTINVRKYQR